MNTSNKCPKCGSSNIVGDCRLTGPCWGVPTRPKGLFRRTACGFHAWLCIECGHMEFYTDPEDLKRIQAKLEKAKE